MTSDLGYLRPSERMVTYDFCFGGHLRLLRVKICNASQAKRLGSLVTSDVLHV